MPGTPKRSRDELRDGGSQEFIDLKNIAVSTNEMVKELKPHVERTLVSMAEVRTELTGLRDRLDRAERRVDQGHVCIQEAVITDLRQDRAELEELTAAHATALVALEQGVTTLKEASRNMSSRRWNLILSLLGMLGFVFAAVWFAASINTQVANNREFYRSGYKQLDDRLTKLERGMDLGPVLREVRGLKEMLENREHEDRDKRQVPISLNLRPVAADASSR